MGKLNAGANSAYELPAENILMFVSTKPSSGTKVLTKCGELGIDPSLPRFIDMSRVEVQLYAETRVIALIHIEDLLDSSHKPL